MFETISRGEIMMALILRSDYRAEGIQFLTPDSFSQQLGYMNRPKGYEIKPHIHNRVTREVHYTNEVLIIRSGKVRVDFYGEDYEYFESSILRKGDIILLIAGGHGFEMLESSEIIEVKQGPYAGDHDKHRFETVQKNLIKIKGK
jgi:mannose-6-phosphate isomerase-like protein (cupin superfamily)